MTSSWSGTLDKKSNTIKSNLCHSKTRWFGTIIFIMIATDRGKHKTWFRSSVLEVASVMEKWVCKLKGVFLHFSWFLKVKESIAKLWIIMKHAKNEEKPFRSYQNPIFWLIPGPRKSNFGYPIHHFSKYFSIAGFFDR